MEMNQLCLMSAVVFILDREAICQWMTGRRIRGIYIHTCIYMYAVYDEVFFGL